MPFVDLRLFNISACGDPSGMEGFATLSPSGEVMPTQSLALGAPTFDDASLLNDEGERAWWQSASLRLRGIIRRTVITALTRYAGGRRTMLGGQATWESLGAWAHQRAMQMRQAGLSRQETWESLGEPGAGENNCAQGH